MSNTTITALPNGNIQTKTEYFDGQDMDTMNREFTLVGNTVHQVWPNGTTSEAFEGLANSGYFLRCADGDVAGAIRRTLA